MRTVTDVFARQEAWIPRDAWPATLIADHMESRHQASTPTPDCLGCVVDQIKAQLAGANAHLGETTSDGEPRYPMPDTTLLDMWGKYRAALNTVYPCPTCRPNQFHRWRHGCYTANHQRKRCRLCIEADKGRAA